MLRRALTRSSQTVLAPGAWRAGAFASSHLSAMFYDLEDPNAFVGDIAGVLTADGVWVIEMHYLPLTLSRNAFDAVCHEHLEYYSLASLEPLLSRHGMVVADVEISQRNQRRQLARLCGPREISPHAKVNARHDRVRAMRAQEKLQTLNLPPTYEKWGERIQRIGDRLGGWLRDERAQGRQISIYGASAGGNTLLQVFALDHSLIRSAAERNPAKWGKYTVGTWIPIVSETEGRTYADDFPDSSVALPARDTGTGTRIPGTGAANLLRRFPEIRVIDSAGVHALK